MNKFIHEPNFSGQSFADRVMAAKHSLAGQDLVRVVYKATTAEVMGPKRKHLDTLVWCTNSPTVSIPQMANSLIERTRHSGWVVVFKALITTHDLINYGNERFLQYLATNSSSFCLSNFFDSATAMGHEMSPFIRRYARYINEKASAYRQTGYDFCKVKRGKEDGFLRTLDTDKLLKALPILQAQIDVLLEFNVTSRELSNGVIIVCFLTMFKDLIRLFACYNDGIINLLEKYFDMNRKHATDALDAYKKFLARMNGVQTFLRIAETVGIDKSEIPDLAKAPSSLLEALEDHLKALDNSRKSGATAAPPKPIARLTTVIRDFSTAAQLGAAPGAGAAGNLVISDNERKRILAEEQRQLDILKAEKVRRSSLTPMAAPRVTPTAAASDNVSTAAPKLVRSSTLGASQATMQISSSASPFTDDFSAPVYSISTKESTVVMATPQGSASQDNSASSATPAPPPGFSSFGDILKPTISASAQKTPITHLDLAALMLTPSTNPQSRPAPRAAGPNGAFGQFSTTPSTITPGGRMVPMTPTYIIPMSPMMYSNYPMQGMSAGQMQPMGMSQQNWMQPRYMMISQPGYGGHPWSSAPTMMQQRPQMTTATPPNDPFGAL